VNKIFHVTARRAGLSSKREIPIDRIDFSLRAAG
jgi:hypothetical protein